MRFNSYKTIKGFEIYSLIDIKMNEIINNLKNFAILKKLNENLFKISDNLRTVSKDLNFNDKSFDSLNCYSNECKIISEDIDCDTNMMHLMESQRLLRMHKCVWPGCNQVFIDFTTLNDHKRVHTRDKPFICRNK